MYTYFSLFREHLLTGYVSNRTRRVCQRMPAAYWATPTVLRIVQIGVGAEWTAPRQIVSKDCLAVLNTCAASQRHLLSSCSKHVGTPHTPLQIAVQQVCKVCAHRLLLRASGPGISGPTQRVPKPSPSNPVSCLHLYEYCLLLRKLSSVPLIGVSSAAM